MKSVGIITIYDLNNYGNRLQNYAVQKVLTDMGFNTKSYTEHYYIQEFIWKYYVKKLFHEITGYRFTLHKEKWAVLNQKLAFGDFVKQYLPTEKVESLDLLEEKADYFVTGSDQVWNPLWYWNHDKEMYLLTFAKPEQKVCFSPSFGIEEFPEEWKTWFQEHLRTFPSLAVREQAGADIIQQLIGQTAQVMIDPTMMLDSKDWLHIAKKPYGVNTRKPFILTYFLGNRTEKIERDIEELLLQKKRNVYNLRDKSQPNVYACGPREFVYLFSKADIILTDSFHACVFSFLFNKPFMVYDREASGVCKMNSRLDTLLGMLKLERKYRSKNIPNDWMECDYSEGWKILKAEREKANTYLKDIMGLN